MKFILHRSVQTRDDHYVCIISGDGIFSPIAKYLARNFSEKDIPTARVKAIDYFWNKQSPKKMSDDLKRYIIRRTTKNPDARFTFIGYSFGAGTLPFALNRLPEPQQNHIKSVILIAPPALADFQFYFRSWFHKSSRLAQDTAPEIQYLSTRLPVYYFYGVDDYIGPKDDIVPHRGLKIIPLKGGHDFDKDYTYLFEQIEQHLGNDYFSPPGP